MSIVIGLVGEKGSVNETFGNCFEEIACDKLVYRVRFSDILLQTLQLWGIPPTRENLQKIAVVMKNGFGADTLTHAISEIIKESHAEIIIVDGVRWKPDAKLIRSFPKNILVYISADVKLRFERLKKRNLSYRKKETKSFEQFMKEEQAENELYIPLIGKEADIKIENNGSLKDFKKAVEKFYAAAVLASSSLV